MVKEIDLVLSGSGTRFPIFIGGLEALQAEDIKIMRLAGTSGGALVGSGIACGLKPEEIKQIILDLDFKSFKDFSLFQLLFRYGLYKGDKIEKAVEKITDGKTFAEIDMDFRVIATDFCRRNTVIFSKETTPDVKLSTAVRASLSVPLIFGFKKYEDSFLVDGIVTSNYALDIFDDNQRPTIGLKTGNQLCPRTCAVKNFNLLQYILMCIDTLITSIEREHVEDATWAKTIYLDASKFNSMDFNLTNDDKYEMFRIGYETTINEIEGKI